MRGQLMIDVASPCKRSLRDLAGGFKPQFGEKKHAACKATRRRGSVVGACRAKAWAQSLAASPPFHSLLSNSLRSTSRLISIIAE
jgi:hypothetical protein